MCLVLRERTKYFRASLAPMLLIYFEQQFICNVREGIVLTYSVTVSGE